MVSLHKIDSLSFTVWN